MAHRWNPFSMEREEPSAEESLGYTVLSYLLAGPLLYGGIGFGLHHWLGWSWAVPVGVLVGVAVSLYLVWFRYGRG